MGYGAGRATRALRGASTLLAACLLLTTATSLPHPPSRDNTSSTPYPPVLHLEILVANTRRLSTQRAGTSGFLFVKRHPHFNPHRPASSSTRARTARPYLSIAHCTPRPLRALPPPALPLLSTAPLPPPLDHCYLALLEHCTRHKALLHHKHGTLPLHLSATTPEFLWQSRPI